MTKPVLRIVVGIRVLPSKSGTDSEVMAMGKHTDAFIKKFRRLSERFSLWKVWADFVTLFAIALSNAVDKTHFEEREKLYLEIINRYNEQERNLFPELCANVITALEINPAQDFLGSIYMELGLGNHWKGQFFTPYSVCQCMAAMTLNNPVEQIRQKGYITINDPACGAGATLIATVNHIDSALHYAKSPLHWQDHVLVTAQDIDPVTGMMCYIQLSLLGCSGYVKIGDSICDPMCAGDSKENYWFMPGYFRDVWHLRRIFHGLTVREVI